MAGSWNVEEGQASNAPTHRLPDTEEDSGRHTTVETLDAVLLVNVVERVENGELLRSVGAWRSLGHRLHLQSGNISISTAIIHASSIHDKFRKRHSPRHE